MINIYNSNENNDKVKVFMSIKNGFITTTTIGNQAFVKKTGFQFYVDEYVAEQIDKLNVRIEGFQIELTLKQGEELTLPEKTEKELKFEQMERELEELRNAE